MHFPAVDWDSDESVRKDMDLLGMNLCLSVGHNNRIVKLER
jgi:hypothetical protein